jgi:hypothetical protein
MADVTREEAEKAVVTYGTYWETWDPTASNAFVARLAQTVVALYDEVANVEAARRQQAEMLMEVRRDATAMLECIDRLRSGWSAVRLLEPVQWVWVHEDKKIDHNGRLINNVEPMTPEQAAVMSHA